MRGLQAVTERTRDTKLTMLGLVAATLLTVVITVPDDASAQPQRRAPEPGPIGRAGASEEQDPAGYWVSVVTEQWHLRMTVPPEGQLSMLPLNEAGRTRAATWDPQSDAAAGNACASYGAPVIMRVPSRLRFQWVDDETLQLDIDSGTQTRLFHFGADARSEQPAPSWQGHSIASWEGTGASRYLVVRTSQLRPGLLRRNGAPYSGDTRLEEHFFAFEEPNGDRWLVVTSIVTDPQNLTRPYTTTNHFKYQRNSAGWDPTACSVDRPR